MTIEFETDLGGVIIRELDGLDDMAAAEQIQARVWGPETCPHPKELLIPVQHEGGLLAGAFHAGEQMVGLLFGFPTRDPAAQHSQMLAALPEWRSQGIGARLKWFQRDWCLERGIRQVRWTVDPLRAANAALNFGKLGAVSNTYYCDYYGAMQGIDAGTPTDRLLVVWDLLSQRVAARARGEKAQEYGLLEATPANRIVGGRPVEANFNLSGPAVLICLPEDFISLARADPALALAWRMQTRALFQHYFSAGYAITGFARREGPTCLLVK